MAPSLSRPPAGLLASGTSRRLESPTLHVMGLALLMLSPGLVVCGLIEWASSSSHDEWALWATAAITAVVGGVLRGGAQVGSEVHRYSVFSAVVWTSIACSLFGALPYVFGSMFSWSTFDDAFFESVSGFTSTGSTVLSDIEAHGRGVLMWRQLTQWYGGMGMVVLAVSVLPFLGVGGLQLVSAEATGPAADRLVPRVSQTARRLWFVYSGITIVVTAALWATPQLDLYDAVAHALTTTATGGFSTYNASIGHFDSVVVELIVVAGLVVGAMNFALHYRALTGDPGAYSRSADTRLFLGWVAGLTLVVSSILWASEQAGPLGALRDGLFNVVTLASSGGFGNVRESGGAGDFVLWPAATQLVLLAVMVVGGCIGSTAGGIKTYRLLIGWRHTSLSLKRARHPQAVLPVKLGGTAVPPAVVSSALGFLLVYFSLAVLGTLVVAASGTDLETSASAVVSALSTMGPALGEAGPASNFAVFDRPVRLLLALLMIVGRLELTAVLLMFAAPARVLADRRRRATRR